MKIGELYDMARGYVPNITPTLFTHFYNIGLGKITNDIRVLVETDTYTISTYTTAPADAVKILDVAVDDERCARLVGGSYVQF